MKKFECLSPLEHDGKPLKVGDTVEMEEATADALVAAGVLKPAAESAKGKKAGE